MSVISIDIGASPSQRLSLAHQCAFDVAAALVANGERAAVVTDSDVCTRELGGRLASHNACFVTEDGFLRESDRFDAVVWAGPQLSDPDMLARALTERLSDGGKACVILHGRSLRFVKSAQVSHLDTSLIKPAGLRRALRANGFEIQRVLAFQNPISFFFGFTAGIFARLGRPRLEDRCQYLMRRTYVSQGFWAALAPVVLISAKGRRND